MIWFFIGDGLLLILLSLPILVWWIKNFEPSTPTKMGSDAYYASPIMVYPIGATIIGLILVIIGLAKCVW